MMNEKLFKFLLNCVIKIFYVNLIYLSKVVFLYNKCNLFYIRYCYLRFENIL